MKLSVEKTLRTWMYRMHRISRTGRYCRARDGAGQSRRTSLNIDAQDIQDKDKQDEKLLHEKLTRSIIGCAFEVINELGSGFLESVYEKAMTIALSEAGLLLSVRSRSKSSFGEKPVGDYFADLLVEEKVVVELKVVKALVPEHAAQTINYLNATGIQVGLLINFGRPTLANSDASPEALPEATGGTGLQGSCRLKTLLIL